MGAGGGSGGVAVARSDVTPLVVVDADVLGRQRTGDETYVRNLLRELGALAGEAGLRVAAVTRRPDLVPEGVQAVELRVRSQEIRMALSLSRVLRRLGADLVHTQYVLPLHCPCSGVVTVHDLSFVRRPELMSLKDRLTFRIVVPRAVRQAARILTVSERTKRDLIELYGIAADRIVVTPNGIDPAFNQADSRPPGSYVLAVGAIQERKSQLAALDAAAAVGLPLVVVGPEKDGALAQELRRRGARVEGYVDPGRLAELYRGAACLVQPSAFEGFGLPVVEAMASGTPVVAVREPALEEVAGGAAVLVDPPDLADGIRRALAERERLVAGGLERARVFSWRRAAEVTLEVYRRALVGSADKPPTGAA
jgi:glycosyltransferase involved in cell wall biosynthesis